MMNKTNKFIYAQIVQFRITCLIIVFIGNAISLSAQMNKKDFSSRNIIINKGDTSIYCSVLIHKTNKKINNKKMYYWYLNGHAGNNIGGYAGYLLHGDYEGFVGDNKLIEKGYFNYGLKHGKWIKWYNNGNIKQIIYYKEGLKHGGEFHYDQTGNVINSLTYKNGKLQLPSDQTILDRLFKNETEATMTDNRNDEKNNAPKSPQAKIMKEKTNSIAEENEIEGKKGIKIKFLHKKETNKEDESESHP